MKKAAKILCVFCLLPMIFNIIAVIYMHHSPSSFDIESTTWNIWLRILCIWLFVCLFLLFVSTVMKRKKCAKQLSWVSSLCKYGKGLFGLCALYCVFVQIGIPNYSSFNGFSHYLWGVWMSALGYFYVLINLIPIALDVEVS